MKLKFVDTYHSHIDEAKRTHIHAHLTLYHSPGCRLLGFIEALIVKTVRHDGLVTLAEIDAERICTTVLA